MCVLSIKVHIRKQSGNVFNEPCIYIYIYMDSIESVKSCLYVKWRSCWSSLGFFDLLRFSKYLTNNLFKE